MNGDVQDVERADRPADEPPEARVGLRPAEFWVVTVLAALALVSIFVSITLFTMNRRLQAEVGARQQYIQQTVQLEGLHRAMVGELMTLAVRTKDDQLAAMLAANGITVPSPSSASPAPSPGPAPKAPRP